MPKMQKARTLIKRYFCRVFFQFEIIHFVKKVYLVSAFTDKCKPILIQPIFTASCSFIFNSHTYSDNAVALQYLSCLLSLMWYPMFLWQVFQKLLDKLFFRCLNCWWHLLSRQCLVLNIYSITDSQLCFYSCNQILLSVDSV